MTAPTDPAAPVMVEGDVTVWTQSASGAVVPPVPTFVTTAMPDQPVPPAITDPTATGA